MTAAILTSPSAGPARAVPRSPRRGSVERVGVVLGVGLLPLLTPSGPGNTGLADLGLVAAIGGFAGWAVTGRHRLRVPYLGPVALMVFAGSLAIILAGAGGLGQLALAQDVLLLAWAAALANLGRDPALLRLGLRAWGVSGICYAGVLVAAVLLHLNALAGISARDGTRASFTLGDPNLAANYFLLALLIVRATRTPRRPVLRWAGCLLLIVAMLFTGSNGGMLALLLATGAGWVFGIARRRGAAPALVAAAGLVLAVAVAAPHVSLAAVSERAAASVPLLRDSVGRAGESGGSRSTLVEEALGNWYAGSLLGYGPAQTKSVLAARQSPYVKEAHDDYVAALLERGVLGAVGLIALVWVLLLRSRRISSGQLRPAYAAAIPRPELLAAAVLAMLLSGFFYEVAHFRHVWALFGVLAAVDLWGRR